MFERKTSEVYMQFIASRFPSMHIILHVKTDQSILKTITGQQTVVGFQYVLLIPLKLWDVDIFHTCCCSRWAQVYTEYESDSSFWYMKNVNMHRWKRPQFVDLSWLVFYLRTQILAWILISRKSIVHHYPTQNICTYACTYICSTYTFWTCAVLILLYATCRHARNCC